MLNMLAEWNMETFVNIFGDSAAWMLIFAGCMAILWFIYEGIRNGGFIRRTKEDFEKYDNISKGLKLIIVLGMILGLLEIATGVVTIMLNIPPSFKYAEVVGEARYDLLTSGLLIILGIAMFMKPMLDAPISALIGLLAAIAVGIILAMVLPPEWVDFATQQTGVNPKWLIVGVAVIVGLIVGAMAKFAIGSLEAIAKVISWPPIALLIAIICFVQGFGLLIWGFSLSALF
jgi:hypothetical protein